MGSKSRTKLARLERRKSVAELTIQGWSQEAIAQQLGVSQPTVSLDLRHITREWSEVCVKYTEHACGMELARLQKLECELWDGWERSKKPAQTAVIDGEGAGQPTSGKARRTIKNQIGDPRFIDLIIKISAQRRALLGLDATPVDGDSDAPNTPDSRRDAVLRLFGELRIERPTKA